MVLTRATSRSDDHHARRRRYRKSRLVSLLIALPKLKPIPNPLLLDLALLYLEPDKLFKLPVRLQAPRLVRSEVGEEDVAFVESGGKDPGEEDPVDEVGFKGEGVKLSAADEKVC
jgi:hypothetical protein